MLLSFKTNRLKFQTRLYTLGSVKLRVRSKAGPSLDDHGCENTIQAHNKGEPRPCPRHNLWRGRGATTKQYRFYAYCHMEENLDKFWQARNILKFADLLETEFTFEYTK